MIKCKEAVENCKNTGMCCLMCEFRDGCEDACEWVGEEKKDPMTCPMAYESSESAELEVFQNATLAIMKDIRNHKLEMERLEAEDKDLRKQLSEAMQKHGIKSFENDILKITSIPETTKTTIDSKKLKLEMPKVFEQYSKTSPVKAQVRIEVKE